MSYDATLDFDAIFGSVRVCPGCGAADIDLAGGLQDAEFRCRSCGSRWHRARAVGEDAETTVPSPRVG